MREILFRGKRVGNGEWANGNYVEKIHYYDGSELPCIQIIMQKPSVADRFVPCFETELVEVVSETVGQYTGLKDRNGKMIFEGDVVRIEDFANYAVKWREDIACWVLQGYIIGNTWGSSMLEVIGNIHDNPELLKEQK